MAENPRIEELRRRVKADPASIAFAALAEEFRRVGRYDEAVETCRTGLQRHPAYLSARVTLGRALIETGDFDGAREELETVLRTAPENLAAIRGLAQIQEQLGHSVEMDPHLADMMEAMHAESLRVAALKPPEPEPVPPELLDEAPVEEAQVTLGGPELSFTPESEPGPELSLAPEPEAPVETMTDPFAGLAPMATPAAGPDFSFDLGGAMTNVEPLTEGSEDVGPDPDVLATLARLERFLSAIQSLRA